VAFTSPANEHHLLSPPLTARRSFYLPPLSIIEAIYYFSLGQLPLPGGVGLPLPWTELLCTVFDARLQEPNGKDSPPRTQQAFMTHFPWEQRGAGDRLILFSAR